MAALKIGITGGIGSGKSYVCNHFASMGVPIYNADTEARNITNTNSIIREKLSILFGHQLYDNNQQLIKEALAKIIFQDKAALERVNSIIHPEVHKHFKQWYEQHQHQAYIIKEAAIMFESGSNKLMDAVVMVYAPLELRVERAMKRDNRTRQQIMERIANQLDDEKKRKMSDYIIINDQQKMLLPQIIQLHQQFLSWKTK